jgi:hypothetical protein
VELVVVGAGVAVSANAAIEPAESMEKVRVEIMTVRLIAIRREVVDIS